MTIIIIGAKGFVGSAVAQICQRREVPYRSYSSPEFSLVHNLDCEKLQVQPRDCVINCAAYTAVDAAENDTELCYTLNAYAPAQLAAYTHANGAWFINLSTDYIFNNPNNDLTTALTPNDRPQPVNGYGSSKLLGEELILTNAADATIIRTSWIYSHNLHGKDFVARIARSALADQEVSVVTDQISSPTYVIDLAGALVDYAQLLAASPAAENEYLAQLPRSYHYSCTGFCSRYQLACSVYSLLGHNPAKVIPIVSQNNKALAPRPSFSALDSSSWAKLGLATPPPWEESLSLAIAHMCKDSSS